jgi:hypothetical protein
MCHIIMELRSLMCPTSTSGRSARICLGFMGSQICYVLGTMGAFLRLKQGVGRCRGSCFEWMHSTGPADSTVYREELTSLQLTSLN